MESSRQAANNSIDATGSIAVTSLSATKKSTSSSTDSPTSTSAAAPSQSGQSPSAGQQVLADGSLETHSNSHPISFDASPGLGAPQASSIAAMHDMATATAGSTIGLTAESMYRCLFPSCFHLCANAQAIQDHVRTAHLPHDKPEILANVPLEQWYEEIPRLAPIFSHVSGLSRHLTPPPSSSTSATTTPNTALTFPDALAALNSQVSTAQTGAAVSLATPPAPGAFFSMPQQQAVRHPHWQPPGWPGALPAVNNQAAPGTPPYVFPQHAMAAIPGAFDALPNQRFMDPAALASGALPSTVYGMQVQAPGKMPKREFRPEGTNPHKVRSDGRKCRKVYGMENKDKWCTQCRWKKACVRFVD